MNELVSCGNLDLERTRVCVDVKVMAQHLLCLFVLLGRGMSSTLIQEIAAKWPPGPFNHIDISWDPCTGQYARIADTRTNLND